MQTVFDFGMYDASDTEYYLSEGYRVVAVEANPALAQRAESRLKEHIRSGRLVVVNAGISSSEEPVQLTISGDDLGSSSMFEETLANRAPLATFTVPAVTTAELLDRHGVPYFLKVDIEGADRLAVLSLTANARPKYVSFEIGDDFEELLRHLRSIGYTRFQAINQCNFRELSTEDSLRDRIALKIVRYVGYSEPTYLRRDGTFFKIGHSSGPGPWSYSRGWREYDQFLDVWKRPKASDTRNVWYDLLAN